MSLIVGRIAFYVPAKESVYAFPTTARISFQCSVLTFKKPVIMTDQSAISLAKTAAEAIIYSAPESSTNGGYFGTQPTDTFLLYEGRGESEATSGSGEMEGVRNIREENGI